MVRPTLLVAEPEPAQALSVRKLVLETGKFNVLTAHSTREALDIFQLFPNLSAAVLVMNHAIDCCQIANAIKATTSKIPIVAIGPRPAQACEDADHNLSSHEPEELLSLLRKLLGDPRKIDNQ